jgi:hypothetical protein
MAREKLRNKYRRRGIESTVGEGSRKLRKKYRRRGIDHKYRRRGIERDRTTRRAGFRSRFRLSVQAQHCGNRRIPMANWRNP